jgi:hypothetical protein
VELGGIAHPTTDEDARNPGSQLEGRRPPILRLLRAGAMSAVISGLCLRSFVHPGYILEVDAVFGPVAPRLRWNFGFPITMLQWLLTHVAGGAVAGKGLFFGALFLSAFGPMWLLIKRSWPVQCVAGLLGALNPWTAERLSEGQYGVVAAAGCLFLVVAAWERLRREPGFRSAALLAVAAAAAVACNAAFLGIVVVMVTCAVVSSREWRQPMTWRWTGVAGGLFAGLLLFGAVPFLFGRGAGSAAALGKVDRAQLAFFSASRSPRYGLLPNLIGLYGSFAERLGRFVVPNASAPWWPVATAILVALAIRGGWHRRERAWLLASGAIGLAISASTATSAGLRGATWLTAHLQLAGVYREPEKWNSLWLVALTVLAAEGTMASGHRRSPSGATAAILMAAAILLPAGLAQVHDLSPQLRPVSYPNDWTLAAAKVRTLVPPGEQVLVLPWHLYEALDFAGSRIVANPARDLFAGRLIYPDDPEIPGQPLPASSGGGLGKLTRARDDSSCRLADALRERHVHWVVIERAPGGTYDADRLLSCGFRAVDGVGTPTLVVRASG